ncbi:hypothetical protein YC2023_063843 [Brassica napus]
MENAFMRSFVRWESPELMNASLSVLRRIRSTQEENNTKQDVDNIRKSNQKKDF